jgi:hypothetical protein
LTFENAKKVEALEQKLGVTKSGKDVTQAVDDLENKYC